MKFDLLFPPTYMGVHMSWALMGGRTWNQMNHRRNAYVDKFEEAMGLPPYSNRRLYLTRHKIPYFLYIIPYLIPNLILTLDRKSIGKHHRYFFLDAISMQNL